MTIVELSYMVAEALDEAALLYNSTGNMPLARKTLKPIAAIIERLLVNKLDIKVGRTSRQ